MIKWVSGQVPRPIGLCRRLHSPLIAGSPETHPLRDTILVTIRKYGTRLSAARETLAESRTRIELAERFELCGGLPPLAHFEGRWFGIRFLSLVPGNQTARAYSEQPDKTRVRVAYNFPYWPIGQYEYNTRSHFFKRRNKRFVSTFFEMAS